MERFIKGDVIFLPFPFTYLSSAKKRPALIISDIKGDDFIMLRITSKNVKDNYAISLMSTDFSSGSLKTDSNIRPNKIFTLDKQLILYKIGHILYLLAYKFPAQTTTKSQGVLLKSPPVEYPQTESLYLQSATGGWSRPYRRPGLLDRKSVV